MAGDLAAGTLGGTIVELRISFRLRNDPAEKLELSDYTLDSKVPDPEKDAYDYYAIAIQKHESSMGSGLSEDGDETIAGLVGFQLKLLIMQAIRGV